MSFDKEVLASNIRAERARKDLKLAELAQQAGISVTSLASYEAGTCIPGADKLYALGEALGVRPDVLLGF